MIISKSQTADMLGLSRQRVSQLITEGIAIEAEGGIDAILTARNYVKRLQRKDPRPLPEGVPCLDESKARKEAAQAGLAELKLAEEKMEVVRIAEIDMRDAKIGAAVRAATMKRRSELPPILEGLSANQIAAILDERDRDFLEMLADQQSEFWQR